MNIVSIIQKKKRNLPLTKEEIDFFVNGYTMGLIPDYQISALLMAIYFNGMNDEEILNFTMAVAKSGDMVNLDNISDIIVDKHSTGGVGDKTTLIITPIVAALGGHIVKMSGRGLGHTGGTIDKLESIEGFGTTLTETEMFEQVKKVGAVIVGQTANLTPADKKLYALRDVTGTVDSIPLIASSVMSKKIAGGAKRIVLDVKVGSGAFMKSVEDATLLAEEMVNIGKNAGRKVIALITNMDVPLGNYIGNSLEVIEAIEVLKGKGPQDLVTVCIELATNMLMLCNGKDRETVRKEVEECIKSGKALEKFKEIVASQGGNIEYIENPAMFEKAKYSEKVTANTTGYIVEMNTEKIGEISSKLGAGRKVKDDEIDYTAGIILNKKVGDYIEKGEELAILYTSKFNNFDEAKEEYIKAIKIVNEDEYNMTYKNIMEEKKKMIYKII